jgi:hypothetical protein
MTISTPPDLPTRRQAGFSDTLDAFLTWFINIFPGEFNAAITALNLNSTTDTSVTSNAIGTGAKSFTVSTGKSYQPGMWLVTADTTAPSTNYMAGPITSYNSGTGALVLSSVVAVGSGTKTAWTISQSAPGGATLGANNFTGLQKFAPGANIASAATINLSTATGNTVHITGTTPISAVTLTSGQWMECIFDAACPLTYHTTNHKLNTGGQSYTCVAGDRVFYFYDGTTVYGFISKADGTAVINQSVPVRQTVLSGPVDVNGLPNFGGATGSTTVTAAGTLVATAANGFNVTGGQVNRTGQISNPAWTGLSTNGTMYLYLDIAADGVCTPGSGILAPNYRWGGTDVITSGQFTFNIQEMVGKVGNGSAASQTYRVYVGEVTVAGGVVTAITWYALMGRYDSGYTNTLPGTATQTVFNHNLGINPDRRQLLLRNLTTELNYAVGDVMAFSYTDSTAGQHMSHPMTTTSKTVSFTTGTAIAFGAPNKTTGAVGTLTAANWAYKVTAERGW